MKVKLHFCDGNEISTSERRPAPGATGGPARGSIGVDRRNERSKDARRVRRERDQRRRAKGAKEGEGRGGRGSVEKESSNTARSRRLTQPAAASQRIYPRAPLFPPPSPPPTSVSVSVSLRLSFSLPSIRLSCSPPVSGLKHSNMLLVSSSFYIGKRQ